jgi:hypothetical protein
MTAGSSFSPVATAASSFVKADALVNSAWIEPFFKDFHDAPSNTVGQSSVQHFWMMFLQFAPFNERVNKAIVSLLCLRALILPFSSSLTSTLLLAGNDISI